MLQVVIWNWSWTCTLTQTQAQAVSYKETLMLMKWSVLPTTDTQSEILSQLTAGGVIAIWQNFWTSPLLFKKYFSTYLDFEGNTFNYSYSVCIMCKFHFGPPGDNYVENPKVAQEVGRLRRRLLQQLFCHLYNHFLDVQMRYRHIYYIYWNIFVSRST